MKLTENSELIMSFLSKKNCVSQTRQTKKTKQILLKLYHEIKSANDFVTAIKNKKGGDFYNLKITRINNVSEIPIPRLYSDKAFPEKVRGHINDHATYLLVYSFSLFQRNIKFKFIVEDELINNNIDVYNRYVDTMLMWMYILNDYSSKECSKELVVYLYFTTLKKILPDTNISILSENNVNTAYTTTCPKVSDIVIFRKEEWFKVFMHETFHNFALDFSDMNVENCTKRILEIFPIKSDVNLFEAYAEFWAELMNVLFCSYFSMHDKNNVDEFLSNAEYFLHFERTFGFFQLVKTLDFMGLKYKDLYSKNKASVSARELLYKENTSVFSYYVLNLILFNNYQGFLSWCDTNNLSLLQFKKTNRNLDEFCNFIEKNYKTASMMDGVNCTENLLDKLKSVSKKSNNKKMSYLLRNMRMTSCELG
jgi:hypothetical protein